MIASRDHQFCIRQFRADRLKSFNHQFQAFVGSPLSEGKNAVFGIPPARKVGKLRPSRENAMRAQVNVIAAIFVVKNLAVSGHEHGN
jgi:hypothetical protein